MNMEPVEISRILSLADSTPQSPEIGELAGRWVVQQILDRNPIAAGVKEKLAAVALSVDLHTANSLVNGSIANLQGLTIVNLNLAGQYQLTDDAIRVIATFPTLTSLNLSGLRFLSTTGLSSLTSLALRSLCISGCDQVTSLEPVAGFSHLTELDTSRCPKLHDNDIEFLRQLPLETLILQSCSGLSAQGTLSRLSGHPTLKVLDISGNRFWKQDKIDEFQRNNPNITVKK